MATASFTKQFVFKAKAIDTIKRIQQQPGIKVPSSSTNRLQEGERKFKLYFSPSKN